jgi:predicted site-specific integrase-resolvase
MENINNKSKNMSIDNIDNEKYVTSKKAMQKLGVSIVTLRTWAFNDLIETIRTSGNHRLYNVDKYLKDCIKKNTNNKDSEKIHNNNDIVNDNINILENKKINTFFNIKNNKIKKKKEKEKDLEFDTESGTYSDSDDIISKSKSYKDNIKEKICYVRVSSSTDINNLYRQKNYMNKYYPTYRIIEDIGSNINLDKKGFKEIINLLLNNKLDTLVITNKYILSANTYDFIYNLFSKYNCKIEILTDKYKNDLAYDIEELINYHKKNNEKIVDM